MGDIKEAYKDIAVAVWQLCTEQQSDDSAVQKPMHRVKVKSKKRLVQNPKNIS